MVVDICAFTTGSLVYDQSRQQQDTTNKQQQMAPHKHNMIVSTNNKTNPRPVMATRRQSDGPSSLSSPAPARRGAASKSSSGQQQNVFIASPGFSSCCRRSFPALCLASSCPVSLFPLLLVLPLLPTSTINAQTQRWSEHANAELRSPRRRSFNRFPRTVRRKRSKCCLLTSWCLSSRCCSVAFVAVLRCIDGH